MKKTFMAPTASMIDIKAENLLTGASGIVSGGEAQSGGTGGVVGGNGGDNLAKGGMGTMSRISTWSMGKMDF